MYEDNSVYAAQGEQFEFGSMGARGLLERAHGSAAKAKRLQFHEAMARINSGAMDPAELFLQMRENQSTSDFPLLFADALDRMLLQGYQERQTDLSAYVKFVTNRDLRARKLFAIDGGEGVNEPIPELGSYPEAKTQESKYEVTTRKYGASFAFSFEQFINDDLGAFGDTPRRMGRKARRTEESVITKLFATDASKAAMFTSGNKNVMLQSLYSDLSVNNARLSVAGVMDAFAVLARQTDSDGQPIAIEGATVVYPAHLEPVVQQIRNTLQIEVITKGGDGNNKLITSNWVAGILNWVPNAQLRIVAQTNPETGWFMFADPNVGRPAIVAARLRGHEMPELWMQSSNAMLVSGGLVDPMMGSFRNDAINFRVRQFIGGAQIDPKSVVFSKGTDQA